MFHLSNRQRHAAAWVAIWASISFAPSVRADGGPNPGPAPTTAPSATAPGTNAPAATEPAIAPPAPGAPPEKIEKAKETAKAAELTPIVPSPQDALRPAFQLYVELDMPVLGVGVVFASARLVKTQPAFCAPLCNPGDLNSIDRLTAGYWSPAWSTASDFGLYGIMAGAAAALIVDEGPLNALNDAVVVAESALSATAVSSILTLAAGRPRPYLFGTSAPLSTRNSADAGLSFLSSHTTVAAALAMSTFMTMRRLHPKGPIPAITLAVGGAVAAFVGLARIEGGNHFITDVVGGAIVGGSMGVLIPSLHGSPVRVVPVVSDTQRGVGVGGTF